MHTLGINICDYPNRNLVDDNSIDSGYAMGYAFQYEKEPTWQGYLVVYTLMTIQSVSVEGAKIRGGFHRGTTSGERDRKKGNIYMGVKMKNRKRRES